MSTNLYIDTRGQSQKPVTFTEAVVEGLAPGGGLYVPQTLPQISLDEILALSDKPYAQQAASIYKKFDIDLDDNTIDELMEVSYGPQFDSPEICPITSLNENTHILELWHGPTSAFKDMALQCLPNFFSASVKKLRNEGQLDHDFLILVATSGDTGKGALEGFKNKESVRIAVMYPDGGVSDIQYKQMATQDGDNTMVWAVEGNFDDCQSGAKAVFSDKQFAEELLSTYHVALSSANSINWGRLLPQIVYYIVSYGRLVSSGKIAAGELIDVCVPTGNFGNILAAWYAKQMGTPLGTLFCASNENRILTDFIQTGEYDIKDREFVLTPSPSMDILISSNMERELFELTGRNANSIAQWMQALNNDKKFSIDPTTLAALQKDFKSDSVDSETCLETIKEVYEQYHYLMDPHTAVAYRVAENLRTDRPVLVASTAHWAKFGENVYRALHGLQLNQPLPGDIQEMSGCELNVRIAEETDIHNIPRNLAMLDELPIRFTEVINKGTDSIENAVRAFLA